MISNLWALGLVKDCKGKNVFKAMPEHEASWNYGLAVIANDSKQLLGSKRAWRLITGDEKRGSTC